MKKILLLFISFFLLLNLCTTANAIPTDPYDFQVTPGNSYVFDVTGLSTLNFRVWFEDPDFEDPDWVDRTTGWTSFYLHWMPGFAYEGSAQENFGPITTLNMWYDHSLAVPVGFVGARFSLNDFPPASSPIAYVDIQTPVPEPATMFLFGIGLIGIAGLSRKK